MKQKVTDIEAKNTTLSKDYELVIRNNNKLTEDNKALSDINKKRTETIKGNDLTIVDLKKQVESLTKKTETLTSVINSTLGKIALVLIGLGCLLVVVGVLGTVYGNNKEQSIKAGIAGGLLVVAGGVVPPLVKRASLAAVWLFWVLVVLLVVWVVYVVYCNWQNEHIKTELVKTVALVGTEGKSITANTAEINLIQSDVTKAEVNRLQQVLDIRNK